MFSGSLDDKYSQMNRPPHFLFGTRLAPFAVISLCGNTQVYIQNMADIRNVSKIIDYPFNRSLFRTGKKGKLQNTTVILNNNMASPVETLLSKKRLVVFYCFCFAKCEYQ